MSVRRMMLFTLGAKIKNLIEAFKTRVFAAQGEFEAETCLETQLTDLDNKGLLDSASFVMTPNGYEENLLFAVSPNTSTADLTVTRATTGTRVNADGLIEQVPYNLFQRSEEFDNAIWFKTGTLVTPNATIAPNNLLTASKVALTNGTDPLSPTAVGLAQNQTIPSGVYVYSIFAKAGERNIIRWRDGGFSGNYLVVNLSDGTFTNGQPTRFVNPQVIPYDDGWYRIIFTTGTITNPSAYPLRFGTTGQIGDGISGGFVWGAQLVTGTQPRDYFPTTNRLNVARIDYSNGSCPSILVEPQRTNLFLRSEEFDNASWIKSTSTISSNVTTAPNGTLTADRLVENIAVGNSYYIQQSAQGNMNTVSIYAKAETRSKLNIFYTAHNSNATFDLIAGTVFSTSGTITASIESVGNGWYRCIASTTLTTHISIRFYLANDAGSVIYNGNGTSGLFIWGAQLELGANATSYIPTVSSTVTRNADVISKTGVSSLIGQTEGTLFLDFNYNSTPSTANGRLYSIFDTNEGVNSILPMILGFGSANINQFQLAVFSNGVVTTPISPSASTFVPFGRQKFAIAYNSSGYTVFRNGALFASNTGALPSSLSAIEVGCSTLSPTRTLGNSINSALIFKTRLTNSQLATLTTL